VRDSAGREVTLPPVDIVCLSSIDWDFNWQGHQTIMSAFAAGGDRVLFIENTGVRRPRLSDTPRLLRRLRNWRSGKAGRRTVAPGLDVLSPLAVPFPYMRWARAVNVRVLRRAIHAWRGAGSPRALVEWSFLPTPLALDLKNLVQPTRLAYYCVDDLPSSSRPARHCRATEERLLREADLVFAASRGLRARAQTFRDEVHLMPFGVDFPSFASDAREPLPSPPELAGLGRPVVGYVGGLHRWLDQELCLGIARAIPEASLVFIGPIQTNVAALRGAPNIHVLGSRPHETLPSYLRAFDVGMIPYRLCEYTQFVYPTKMNEYLATGLPVVATPLPEVVAFSQDHPGVVEVAESPETFVAAIRRSAQGLGGPQRSRRIEVARLSDWTTRVAHMRELLGRSLAGGAE
jgi:glycosyltransferase involved in cell wall biosynthesis